MALASYEVENPHLIPIMQGAEHSLSFLVEDLQSRRREALGDGKSGSDLEAWVNALQRQSRPLVASTQGRANLEAWLALVEA